MTAYFINKLFRDLTLEEKNGIPKPFICLHSPDPNGYPYFEYLVVDLTRNEDKQFIARFQNLELAKEYVEWITQ